MPQFTLVLGALADPIEKQLAEQGLSLVDQPNAQRLADAISNLFIASILTDSETTRARQRFIKKLRVEPITTK